MTAMTSCDLINKPKKLFIRSELIVRVLKVHEVQETSVRHHKRTAYTAFWTKAPPGRKKNIPKGTASNG